MAEDGRPHLVFLRVREANTVNTRILHHKSLMQLGWKTYVPKRIGGEKVAKCPKCGMEVSSPRKTWKMAGRPDKSGKRNELTIGLFDHCGKAFRVVLGKKKI